MEVEKTVEPSVLEKAEDELEQKEQEEFGDELPDFRVGGIVKKQQFLVEQEVVINRPCLNMFGKPAIMIEHETEELTGELTIGNALFMELKKKFGSKKADWSNKKVTFQAEEFKKESRNGEMLEGYTLKIVK